MAPPHTSKKNGATASQKTFRHGTRQVKQQRVEQYEEEVLNGQEEADELGDDEALLDELASGAVTEASQDASQPNPVQKLLRDMQADQHKRNEIRKKAVYKGYEEAHANTQDAITSHFDEHQARASEAHEAQMTRLKDLLKMKAEIESVMSEKLVELRKDYVYHSKALEMVVEHRLKQLNR